MDSILKSYSRFLRPSLLTLVQIKKKKKTNEENYIKKQRIKAMGPIFPYTVLSKQIFKECNEILSYS
jgi:hypothetical protein